MPNETIEIEVSSEEVATEVAFGILARANQIHENPDDKFEHIAIELRDVGQALLAEYNDTYTQEE